MGMGLRSDVVVLVPIAFIITLVAIPLLIAASRRLGYSQPIREEGPKTHLKKRGTPTMGGLSFWFSVLAVGAVRFADRDVRLLALVFVLFGLVGLADDLRKVIAKNPGGIPARAKLLGQSVGAVVFLAIAFAGSSKTIPLDVPGQHIADVSAILYMTIAGIMMVGTSNAINFADGADGLLSMMALPTLGFLVVFSNNQSVRLMSLVLIATLLAFLVYNKYPAKIIMGDTGSMALGGAICAMFFLSDLELALPLVCLPYYAEVLSVTIQVASFKLTGKRVFKMSPLHHHFELSGWSENKLVLAFFVASLVSAVAGAGLLTVVKVVS